jgi:asparagine synthase (glutamine-hydrolysing)
MSGICGICESAVTFGEHNVWPMLEGVSLPGDDAREVIAGRSFAAGLSRHWPGQQLARIAGVQIVANTDLVDTGALENLVRRGGIDVAGLNAAELLAWGYKLQGIPFLDSLVGAFALAIWDDDAQRLLLVVDRFGINPVYWTIQGRRLWFASGPRALLASGDLAPDIDPAAVTQFLLFSAVSAPLSIYRGVSRMKPGTYLVFERGTCQEKTYWDMQYDEDTSQSEEYWSSELRSQLRSAVRCHAEDLSPSSGGAYLSGGTDSSSVVAFMNERQSPVQTFSIVFANPRYSEIEFARTTADHFKTRHFEKSLTPEDAQLAVDKITEYFDEPFANSSAIGGYHCALLARESGVDTLLGGDGGDELFAGNERYSTDKKFQAYHSIPAFLREGLLEPAARLLPDNGSIWSRPRRYVKRAGLANPARIFSYSHFLSCDPGEIFESDFLRQVPREQWLGIAENHFCRPSASELNRILYMDLKMTLTDNDIPKVLGTAEIAGVKARFPLLDHRLAEFSGRIPSQLKLKGLQKRYIFKKAMQGILPEMVLNKKKHGFGVPLASWLLQDPRLNAFMRDVLCDPATRQRGIFRRQFFDEVMQLHRQEHTIFYGEIIWYLMVFELWQRRQGKFAASCVAAS